MKNSLSFLIIRLPELPGLMLKHMPDGKQRVIRGGGWRSGMSCVAVHFRQSLRPYWVDFNVGFRCAKDF
jgi:formylglycine-generating enzyme required for sulfatase activity